jgi:hypothetical protein
MLNWEIVIYELNQRPVFNQVNMVKKKKKTLDNINLSLNHDQGRQYQINNTNTY